jgi:hypothetical protein
VTEVGLVKAACERKFKPAPCLSGGRHYDALPLPLPDLREDFLGAAFLADFLAAFFFAIVKVC